MENNSLVEYICKKFKLNLSDKSDKNLILDLYQEIELFILEKGLLEDHFFNTLYNNPDLSEEFNKYIYQSYKTNKGFSNNEFEIDFEEELEKEKHAVFIDIDYLLKDRRSAVYYDEKQKEIIGLELLKESLPLIEYESFIYKVQKPANYEYLLISGLNNSGIDVFFKRAIERLKIFQQKEKSTRKLRK